MKRKILIADYMFNVVPKVPDDRWIDLRHKFRVVKHNYCRMLTSDEIYQLAKGCTGIVAGIEKVYDQNFFQKFPEIRCLSRTGAGIDNIDLDAAKDRKVIVRNCPDAVMEAASELSIGMILSLLRKIPTANKEVKEGKWNQFHGNLLMGETVGIVGMGRIGKRVAVLLKPFGCKILGNDLVPDTEWSSQNFVELVDKRVLYANSDIICFHPSMLPQNLHMVDDRAISSMKNGVLIVNLSRGPIIDETSLLKFLKNGKVAGAALDVFETEPYKGQLTKMENVILTPHIGGSTHESRYKMQMRALDNLEEELANLK